MSDETTMNPEVFRALQEVVRKVGYVQNDARNSHQGYNYASEAAILAATRTAMLDAGLTLMPSIVRTNHGTRQNKKDEPVCYVQIDMNYTLVHAQTGHSFSMPWSGYAEDVGDKGIWKAITGAKKYFLLNLMLLVTGDDPERHDIAAPKEDGELILKLKGKRASQAAAGKFWEWVNSMPGLSETNAREVLAECAGEIGNATPCLRMMSADSVGYQPPEGEDLNQKCDEAIRAAGTNNAAN